MQIEVSLWREMWLSQMSVYLWLAEVQSFGQSSMHVDDLSASAAVHGDRKLRAKSCADIRIVLLKGSGPTDVEELNTC